MAKITFKGLEEYETLLSRLGKESGRIAGMAVYQGADIVADSIRQNIGSLPQRTGVTKRGLEEGFGIAPLQNDNGFYNVKLGFHGYNADGKPNAMMARLLESGKSNLPKTAFVRKAVKSSKKEAEAKMAEVIDNEIKKIMDTKE